jgi:hypothetical protein
MTVKERPLPIMCVLIQAQAQTQTQAQAHTQAQAQTYYNTYIYRIIVLDFYNQEDFYIVGIEKPPPP